MQPCPELDAPILPLMLLSYSCLWCEAAIKLKAKLAWMSRQRLVAWVWCEVRKALAQKHAVKIPLLLPLQCTHTHLAEPSHNTSIKPSSVKGSTRLKVSHSVFLIYHVPLSHLIYFSCWSVFTANTSAMYYGYCMLPDGTYCLAPPPPGIDASGYYGSIPPGMMPAHSVSGAPPPPGTTPPPPDPVTAVPSAPSAAPALAPVSPAVSHSASTGLTSTRCVCIWPLHTRLHYTCWLELIKDHMHLMASSVSLFSSHAPQASVCQPAPAAAIIPPPPDIQPVIDKLAEYVARNGVKFESSVRAKNDPR